MIALYVVLFFLLQITFVAGLMNGSNRKMGRKYRTDVSQVSDIVVVIVFGLIPVFGPIGALFGSMIACGGEFFGFSLDFSKQTFK